MSLEQDITQIMEADIFKPASQQELAAREAARQVEIQKKIKEFQKTHKETDRFLKEGVCPVCGSENLEYTDQDEYEGEMTHEFVCNDCDTVSEDIFSKIYKETYITQLPDGIERGEAV